MAGDERKAGQGLLSPELRKSLKYASIFAVCCLLLGALLQGLNYHEASRNADSYAANSQNQIWSECILSTLSERATCSRQINDSARQNQRDEYDLYSQKSMAIWTTIMGGMAVIGVSLSGVGVYLIYETWGATREASENSRKTLQSYIWKERAHIVTSVAEPSDSSADSGCDGFKIELKNIGLSPAQIFAVNYKYVPQKKWQPNGMAIHGKRILIPAGTEAPTAHLKAKPLVESWLIGSVEYATLDSQKFVSYFCYEIAFREMEFSIDRWVADQQHPIAMPNDS